MELLIDTCVLPRCRLEEAQIYKDRFGSDVGFELLPMFDLAAFEKNLETNLPLFTGGRLFFHEPVWGVEHSAPKGSRAYEKGMYHILMTKKFAEILHPTDMVYHLNNCRVPYDKKDEMLRISLENLEEIRSMFPGTRILVENSGTDIERNKLLNQKEFTELCRKKNLDVLIDIGHANANSWDLFRVITELKDHIRGYHFHNNDGMNDLHDRIYDGMIDFEELLPFIAETTPDAVWVIEYTRPEYHGAPLLEDIAALLRYKEHRG